MRSRYDAEADALAVRFADAPVPIVAVEIPDASKHLSAGTDLPSLTVA